MGGGHDLNLNTSLRQNTNKCMQANWVSVCVHTSSISEMKGRTQRSSKVLFGYHIGFVVFVFAAFIMDIVSAPKHSTPWLLLLKSELTDARWFSERSSTEVWSSITWVDTFNRFMILFLPEVTSEHPKNTRQTINLCTGRLIFPTDPAAGLKVWLWSFLHSSASCISRDFHTRFVLFCWNDSMNSCSR